MSAQQLDAATQAKLQLMQEMEVEMMSDLYSRMTTACHKKCIPPKYSDAELGKSLWGYPTPKSSQLICSAIYICRQGRIRLPGPVRGQVSGDSRADRQEADGHVRPG